MDNTTEQSPSVNTNITPFNNGIIIDDNYVQDPNDNKIYKNTSHWGQILLGNSQSWHDWWDYPD